jgi:serine/threonine-protein kinase RIO1
MLKQLKPPKFKAALKFYKSRILKKQNLRNYAYGDFKLNDLCVEKKLHFLFANTCFFTC